MIGRTDTTSFFTKVKMQFYYLLKKIKAHKSTLFDIALYLGIGFLLGFTFKKFGQYIIAAIIILFLLHQFNIISLTVYWDKIQDFLGLKPVAVVQGNILEIFINWVKLNFIVVMSFAVGFLLGLKVK